MSKIVQDCIDGILENEGGFSNIANDRGGATNFGITIKTYSQWLGREATVDDVKNMPIEHARAIYERDYVINTGFNMIENKSLFELVVDAGVNHGVGRASRWLQESAGVVVDGIVGNKTIAAVNANSKDVFHKFFLTRMRFYVNIVLRNRSQKLFLLGWMNRLSKFEYDNNVDFTEC